MKKIFIRILTAAVLGGFLLACETKKTNEPVDLSKPNYSATDTLVLNTIHAVDRRIFMGAARYSERAEFLRDSLMAFIDSVQKSGSLSELGADALRVRVFRYSNDNARTEKWARQAVTHNSLEDRKQWYYNYAAGLLARLQYDKHNYEGYLRVAVPLLASMDSLGNGTYEEKIDLYSLMACCYIKLGQPDNAKAVAQKAHNYCWEVLAVDSTVGIHQVFINAFSCIKDAYVREKNWEEVRRWMAVNDSVGKLFERRHPDAQVWPIYHAYTHLDRAIKLWSIGNTDSAAVEYDEFRKTKSAHTLNGIISSNDYLMNAERWAEAADNYQVLDYCALHPGLEEIYSYYFPKFRANYNAMFKDSALFVAHQISELFDSAYINQKRNQMAEMAIVYDTQGKEMQIARQQAELSQQRLIGTLAALVLLTLFFVVYTLHRRKAQKRLASAHSSLEAAHTELKSAYDQLEETTTAKERIESELRIARDIQMSMVPSIFPEYEGLDMYASMTPAKEVGGDLYGYILQGDRLYFAVGDVSGKGVPASLFMAQATRLFRTLATQGMMPAEICTRMNDALSGEDNVNGMFVTFFLGLIDLKTGHLDFCNAGHNPPVIGGGENHGDFLDMLPNAPIGLWPGLEFEGEELDNIKGRPLFIYTDGLNEAENKQQEQFSDERLLDILRSTKFDSAYQVIETLKAEVEKHRNGAEPNDDLTMMCIRAT